jgi:hypothetical protein
MGKVWIGRLGEQSAKERRIDTETPTHHNESGMGVQEL